MAWRAITEPDILTQLSAGELDTLRAQADVDPLPAAMAAMQEHVRGSVAAHRANIMGAEGTIPERLMSAAVSLLVVRLYSANAGLLVDLDDTRKAAAKSAERLLERVAEGKYAVELPGDVGESTEDGTSSSAELITASKNPLRRDDLAGL